MRERRWEEEEEKVDGGRDLCLAVTGGARGLGRNRGARNGLEAVLALLRPAPDWLKGGAWQMSLQGFWVASAGSLCLHRVGPLLIFCLLAPKPA